MNKKAETKQSIEELTERYARLDKKKTTAEANLNNAKDQLEKLKKEAREQYGTDDLQELKKMLKEMEEENERKRSEYQASLDKIEKELAEVENNYQNLSVKNESQ